MIRPGRILLILLVFNLILLGVVLAFPSGNIRVFDANLRFISLDRLLHPKEIKYADINEILRKSATSSVDSNFQNGGFSAEDSQQLVVNPANPDALRNISYKIQYPDSSANLLKPFFDELDALQNKPSLIRIVHYGDSQIEGDRISGMLRYMMQHKFGGCGAGVLPVFDVADIRSSVRLAASSNWYKYATYGGLYKGAKTRSYGLLNSIFRYGVVEDSLPENDEWQKHNAWISVSRSHEALPNTNRARQVRLICGNIPSRVRLKISAGKTILVKDTLPASPGFHIFSWPLDTFEKELRFDFNADRSPDIFGLALDGTSGVEVDNVSMRGSSGLDFGRQDFGFLAAQLREMNTKLVILQYGVNVVPNVVDNYAFYERGFYRILKMFRDNLPGVSILVIGVSDMAQKSGSDYVSYPNITKIRDAQRRAAFHAGCAFWDLYEAMGGENSMVGWVNAKPSLAQKDYTHFNPKGARIIGEMIYNALMSDYLARKNAEVQ